MVGQKTDFLRRETFYFLFYYFIMFPSFSLRLFRILFCSSTNKAFLAIRFKGERKGGRENEGGECNTLALESF